MNTSKLDKETMVAKAEEARRSDEAKRVYAEKHGLDPITLKPVSTATGPALTDL